jgi:hypothetical protein
MPVMGGIESSMLILGLINEDMKRFKSAKRKDKGDFSSSIVDSKKLSFKKIK